MDSLLAIYPTARKVDDLLKRQSREGCQMGHRVVTFAAILASYEASLDERGLADTHDRERAVLDALLQAGRQGTRPRFLAGVTHLLVAEIYDFGLLQFMIVAALIRLVGDAELTIQAEPRTVNANRFPELTWNRFVSEESIADKVLPQFVRRGGRQGRLGFLLTHVFSGNYPTPPLPDGAVSIIEAPTRRREVEEVARAIRRVLERPPSGQIPLERIAMVIGAKRFLAFLTLLTYASRQRPIAACSPRPATSTA